MAYLTILRRFGDTKTIVMYKLAVAFVMLVIAMPFVSFSQSNSEEMKAMMAAAAPGDIHKMLAKSAGSWTASVTMWMEAGAPPTTSSAEASHTMHMRGRG